MLTVDVIGMCMKIFLSAIILCLVVSTNTFAQYSAQNDAMYLAIVKAVADYKIADEENIKDVESLRSNQRFMNELSQMMGKLSNRRAKNSVNTRVYKILIKAGKEIYNELK